MQVLALNLQIVTWFVGMVEQHLLTGDAAAAVATQLQVERVSHAHLAPPIIE